MSNDPLTKHRALHLQHLGTELSGRYACRVSSIFQEDFKINNSFYVISFYVYDKENICLLPIYMYCNIPKSSVVQPCCNSPHLMWDKQDFLDIEICINCFWIIFRIKYL